MEDIMRAALLIPAIIFVTMLLGACETEENAGNVPTTKGDTTNDVAYSFAVIGCNRIDYTDTSASNPSTANLVQLQRTFQEIAALDPKPAMLFFTGDLVLGLTRDTAKLAAELQAWLAVYNASPLAGSGIRLVALPGNHEALYLDSTYAELPDPGFERVWLRLMAPYIAGSNGPGPGGPDNLATDQSRLTYSFEYRDSHFVIANTDTYDSASTLPVNWIAADVAAARSNPAVRHIFLLGHKPAYPSPLDDEKDCLNRYPAMRNQLWSALEGSRCEAMLAAHNHLYYKVRPDSGKTWQVIAGNGGSSLIPGLDAKDMFFGFSVVTVTKGGRVYLKSMGRDQPAGGYLAPCPASQYPTTLRDSVELTWGM
jgi:hypothetical protein